MTDRRSIAELRALADKFGGYGHLIAHEMVDEIELLREAQQPDAGRIYSHDYEWRKAQPPDAGAGARVFSDDLILKARAELPPCPACGSEFVIWADGVCLCFPCQHRWRLALSPRAAEDAGAGGPQYRVGEQAYLELRDQLQKAEAERDMWQRRAEDGLDAAQKAATRAAAAEARVAALETYRELAQKKK